MYIPENRSSQTRKDYGMYMGRELIINTNTLRIYSSNFKITDTKTEIVYFVRTCYSMKYVTPLKVIAP